MGNAAAGVVVEDAGERVEEDALFVDPSTDHPLCYRVKRITTALGSFQTVWWADERLETRSPHHEEGLAETGQRILGPGGEDSGGAASHCRERRTSYLGKAGI